MSAAETLPSLDDHAHSEDNHHGEDRYKMPYTLLSIWH